VKYLLSKRNGLKWFPKHDMIVLIQADDMLYGYMIMIYDYFQ
jgi:hypothetical protein